MNAVQMLISQQLSWLWPWEHPASLRERCRRLSGALAGGSCPFPGKAGAEGWHLCVTELAIPVNVPW